MPSTDRRQAGRRLSGPAICRHVRGPVYSGPRIAFECPGWQLLVRIFREFRLEAASEWVLSSVGRAAPLQGVGHRFDPCSTHQKHSMRVRPNSGSGKESARQTGRGQICFPRKTRTLRSGGFFVLSLVFHCLLRGARHPFPCLHLDPGQKYRTGSDEIGRANHSHLRYYCGLVPVSRRRHRVCVFPGWPDKSMHSG